MVRAPGAMSAGRVEPGALLGADGRYVGISEVAESTGFSLDTLRWYEREGLHQERIVARLVEMHDDLAVLEKKVEHYRYLIEQGLDCDAP